MKKKTAIEMERQVLASRIRAEATILRLRWLNEVLPAVLEEFDRRVLSGESTKLALPSVEDFIQKSLDELTGGDDAAA